MTDILASIDGALDAHATIAAEVTGNPWPGRVPDLDEMVDVLFGPEDGAPLPEWWQGVSLVRADSMAGQAAARARPAPLRPRREVRRVPVPVAIDVTWSTNPVVTDETLTFEWREVVVW